MQTLAAGEVISPVSRFARGLRPPGFGKKDGMSDLSHKSKTANLALWMGFADELQKIAAATTTSQITKMVARKSTLAATPKMTSKPVVKEPQPPAATLDHLSSTRTIQPPPVTMPAAP